MGLRRSHRSLAVALLMALTGSVLALVPARPAAAEFFDPLAVPAQIAVLLALTTGLFDAVPLPRMAEAQRAVQDAAAQLAAPLRERMVGENKLNDEDCKVITDSAAAVLKAFLPKPDVKPAAKVAARRVVK